MDEDDATYINPERIKQLGFKPQKEIVYNKLLPYADQLDVESKNAFAQIKINLSKSVMLRELHPGCSVWSARLTGYIKLYGLKFSKEDHVALVNLLYEVLTIPNLEPHLVYKFAQTLIILLKKKYLLSPEDIILDWRPLYNLCQQTVESKHGLCRYYSSLEHTLVFLVHCARHYFTHTATQEILDELKPQLTTTFCQPNSMDLLAWFLPVSLPPERTHLGYKLWLTEVMDMWATCNNIPSWEPQVMKLVANLASSNVGYIDWEPYIPIMFTRFLRSFNLPVAYKQFQKSKLQKTETSAIAVWIVSALDRENSCQKYLDKFLKTIESYFHPANFVRISENPSSPGERYKKITWETPVPESRKLTEEDIDRFVESMKGIAMQAVFSKVGCNDASIALQHLATLRPKIIVPALIERFYSTLDSLTEPHKLTSVMHCVAMVARPLVQGPKYGYPEGPTHVIPLLLSTLPGIDANDFKKCFVTIQFILVLVTLVPLVDSSKAMDHWSDLTEEEEVTCAATASFEDFVVNFFDRIFNFVENSSLEPTRMEKDSSQRSKVENLAETAISSTALKKLQTFLTERILETKWAGPVVASLCKTFSRVNPDETLKNLVPHFCSTILTLTESEEVQKEEILDEELHYNLLILAELVDCRYGIVPYVQQLLPVLDRTLKLSSREGFVLGSKLLDHILLSLTTVCPTENRALPRAYDTHVKDYLPVREWGEPAKINKLNLKWHVPGTEERKLVEEIVHKYLPVELQRIEKHIGDERTLSRTELLCSLNVIYGILGAHSMLPVWDEEPLTLVESALKLHSWIVTLGVDESVYMPDGSNVKFAIAQTMDKLQKKMLFCAEDDTKSLFAIIQIWERLISNKARLQNDFEGSWKNFQIAKKFFENPLVKKKRHMRVVLIERTLLQHESRTENTKRCLTKTHKMIMLNLLELSCGHYSKVRMKAQSSLFKGLIYFSFSYTVLIPQLLENLQCNTAENHERYKGTLYVLSGPKQMPMIARFNWKILDLWLALVKAQPSEKLSVVKLLDGLMKIIHKHFPTMTIDLEISDTCVEKARAVLELGGNSSETEVTSSQIEDGKIALEENGKLREKQYLGLLNSFLEALEKNNLHWRYFSMALAFLRDLAHPDIPYPAGIVKTFLYTLINDSLELRKIAIKSTLYLLIQQKRKSKKIRLDIEKMTGNALPEKPTPGIRPDNLWLQYDSKRLPKSQQEWDEPRFIHKRTFGYFQWPKELEIYAPTSQQPHVDRDPSELRPDEKEVFEFFSNPKNVAQLIAYFSLEEKKGKDKFSGTKFWMFKYLFRNHGDSFLHVFKPHLESLVVDDHESSQRCASEIIGGLIRGSKHWPYEKVSSLWRFLGPLIRTGLSNMTEETVRDWGSCFASAAENIDPNRNYWLLEILMENPFTEKSSFLGCGRLFALQGALLQQEWRVAELYKRLLTCFDPYLSHPFQNVRERIACALVNIFQADITFAGSITLGPHPEDFMASIVKKLDVLFSLTNSAVNVSNTLIEPKNNSTVNDIANKLMNVHFDDEVSNEKSSIILPDYSDKDSAFRLLKTVCTWIAGTLTKTHRNTLPEFYLIFPLICSLESYDQDEELVRLCSTTLAALARSATSPQDIPVVLKSIETVAQSGSWWARSSVVVFLQVFIFHNMSLVLSIPEWANESTQIVLNLLEDKRVEVREKAAEVLGGLIHCDFISNTNVLLQSFKKKAKLKNTGNLTGHNPDFLRLRHAGILGLCSFINSSPYDVPDYVPEIFFILGNHLNDPQPIPSTIRKTLGDFKRTHHDNWECHKLKFTERQLEVLNDINVPPSYYA
ncbi:hypothetical protein RUM43_007773 [Polyplax serrata]|uniref:Proteasome activator complex subunit 4 n=1 Tax=Polyplax serrata TaxID=468196 RepID=A0AAN8P982_POLSC